MPIVVFSLISDINRRAGLPSCRSLAKRLNLEAGGDGQSATLDLAFAISLDRYVASDE
jgi:hypothetical protein